MLPENCTTMYLQQIKGKEYLLQLKTDPSSPIYYLTRTSCYHKYVRHRNDDEIYKKEDRTIKQKASEL